MQPSLYGKINAISCKTKITAYEFLTCKVFCGPHLLPNLQQSLRLDWLCLGR